MKVTRKLNGSELELGVSADEPGGPSSWVDDGFGAELEPEVVGEIETVASERVDWPNAMLAVGQPR